MFDWRMLLESAVGDGRYRMLRNKKTCERGHRQYAEQFKKTQAPRNILLCCPAHNNIGDHAIAYAERRLLAKTGRPLLSFSGNMTELLSCLHEFVTPEDIIFLHGGGNMGYLYRWEEQYRCDIISLLHRNRIILFPQTISYDDSPESRCFLKHTQTVYNRHRDLHLFARERTSFARMKQYYPHNDVRLTPDIVLSIDDQDTADFNQRSGILLCMRNDVEKVTSNAMQERIERAATSTGERITYTDTTITDDSAISAERGEHLVLDKFAEFRKARLVITDRLHGMIFSAITGTPCIALNNSNGKVGMEYFWLQDLPYITFAEDVDALESLLPDMMNIADTHYPAEYFMRKFDSLTDLLS